MDKSKQTPDYDKPVAYDAEGRPLYSRPYENENDNKQSSHNKPISDIDMLKHERSKKSFPNLDLNVGDYVVSSVRRHPIGLVLPFISGIILISAAFFLLFNYDLIAKSFQLTGSAADSSTIILPVIIFIILVMIGEYIAYYIYSSNTFFLTNDSIIQEIQTGLFSKSEHIVSLGNIEDASYSQDGIIQHLLNYGSIRLSTVGDETTYRFLYVANPKAQITMLNNAVDNFKNYQKPC